MESLFHRAFTAVKAVLFERGHLVYWLNIPSFRHSVKTVRALPRKDKARIGFIMQLPNNWAAIQSVYEAALKDPRTEPVVLLMPELEFFCYIRLRKILWKKTYAFGEERFGDRAVQLWDPEKETWKTLLHTK